ncbi:RagB/SusD family nutrient uptake outer membrane protein [Sphingobacterium olei]|uniref:RagB/SusD family nutrient uptake outer membrane protein n=1 Tax=Sphingobacterium olei TaxID=2571155 RepID=A0A4U0P0I1_9SPHI|nr:RagB/SusD family nutrient uptake outer membrane protein [Sphingobacterium olei]TJZ60520.1 RagB/SusD family nutrient uptake outer membrane protein [Sphingobacterium olei]
MNTIKRYFKTLLLLFSLTGCGKEFLDIKRNSNQVVPKNISDYQALLDYNPVMNNAGSFELVCLGTDEYTLPGKTWETASPVYYTHVKNGYIWADDVYEGKEVNDWNWAYQRIMYANLALDVDKLEVSPDQENNRNNVRGQAMFHRAFTFYQLVQAFCKPFNPGSAETDPGIPLRLDYDVSVTVDRGTLKEVYAQILQDLTTAVDLLPDFQENNYRPSRLATYALLARVYREMDRWDEALASVQYVLERKLDLLNFNDFDDAGLYSFENMNRGLLNPEILFYCHTSAGYIQSNGVVTEEFINKYKDHDLRKYLFFKDDKKFYGSYEDIPLRAFVDEMSRWEGFTVKDWRCIPRDKKINVSVCYLNDRQEVYAAIRKAGVLLYEENGMISFCAEDNNRRVVFKQSNDVGKPYLDHESERSVHNEWK